MVRPEIRRWMAASRFRSFHHGRRFSSTDWTALCGGYSTCWCALKVTVYLTCATKPHQPSSSYMTRLLYIRSQPSLDMISPVSTAVLPYSSEAPVVALQSAGLTKRSPRLHMCSICIPWCMPYQVCILAIGDGVALTGQPNQMNGVHPAEHPTTPHSQAVPSKHEQDMKSGAAIMCVTAAST